MSGVLEVFMQSEFLCADEGLLLKCCDDAHELYAEHMVSVVNSEYPDIRVCVWDEMGITTLSGVDPACGNRVLALMRSAHASWRDAIPDEWRDVS